MTATGTLLSSSSEHQNPENDKKHYFRMHESEVWKDHMSVWWHTKNGSHVSTLRTGSNTGIYIGLVTESILRNSRILQNPIFRMHGSGVWEVHMAFWWHAKGGSHISTLRAGPNTGIYIGMGTEPIIRNSWILPTALIRPVANPYPQPQGQLPTWPWDTLTHVHVYI